MKGRNNMFDKLMNKVKDISGLWGGQDKDHKTNQNQFENNANTHKGSVVADSKEMEKGIKDIMKDNSK
jgi:gas vesicle protein